MKIVIENIRQELQYMEWCIDNAEDFADAHVSLPESLADSARKIVQMVQDASDANHEPHTPAGSKLYPRKCVECGEGMQEGYLSEDGDTWCSDDCLFTKGYTPEQYQKDHEADTCFWTDWEWNNGWGEQWTKDGTCYLFDAANNIWKEEVNNA